MSIYNRRQFIRQCGMVSLGFVGFQLFACGESPQTLNYGYGNLLEDPLGKINLPKGFSYEIISTKGELMNDGLLVPGKPDGMAAFDGPAGKIVLVRNHENSHRELSQSGFGKKNELLSKIKKEKFYDYGRGKPGLGGTTTLLYNPSTGKVEQQFMSLTGTIRNCAGGSTPWGSWITCEESVVKAGKKLEKNHGYNFEVPAKINSGLVDPIPLKAMGRFNHEAVCVDPRTGIVYQTEDRDDSLIYRFIPNKKGRLLEGGKLQALKIKTQQSWDTRNWNDLKTDKIPTKQLFDVEWIDMDQIDAPKDDLRHRGFNQGAARFARGEGMWFGNGELFFACTNGGDLMKGQIFRYIPSEFEGTSKEQTQAGKLELYVEPNDADLCEYCDNLTVAPWGDVVFAEDKASPSLVGITPKGQFYKIAHNVGIPSEFAGVCFSPDGRTLFVNVQHAGLTLAIRGPWRKMKEIG